MGFMFGGKGYIILHRDRFRPGKTSLVGLKFKTFAENGLIFLIGFPGKDYLSLEIREGKLFYQYDLGSGRAEMKSLQRVNDGQWHHVSANRLNQDGILKVDSVTGECVTSCHVEHVITLVQ